MRSSRIRHPLLVPGTRDHHRRAGRRYLRPRLRAADAAVRVPWADHPPQVSRRVRPHGMDQATLWHRGDALPQLHVAVHAVPVHGFGALGHRTGCRPTDRP